MEQVGEQIAEERAAHHPERFKDEMVSRLNRIRGQVNGISRMISEDVYCDDILNQISSVSAALNGVKRKLLEAHVRTCVVEQIEAGDKEVVDELMSTIKKML